MPAINERIDRVVEQIKMKYNELKNKQKDNYGNSNQ
jgi:hypothetical protein